MCGSKDAVFQFFFIHSKCNGTFSPAYLHLPLPNPHRMGGKSHSERKSTPVFHYLKSSRWTDSLIISRESDVSLFPPNLTCVGGYCSSIPCQAPCPAQ